MNRKNTLSLYILFFFIPLTVFLQTGCSGRQRPENKGTDIISSREKDSTFLFDGKTLEGWKITDFGTQGPVYISGERIILGMGDGCTGITWQKSFPVVNYEVNLDAMRIDGNDFFCGMTFPAGSSHCTLVVGGWAGPVVGLSVIDGLDASENETRTYQKFNSDQWYSIRLQVLENHIKAWIDTTIVIDFVIDKKVLTVRPEVELSKPFGIASWMTTAAIRNIQVRDIEFSK
jgi:hypothetical protein